MGYAAARLRIRAGRTAEGPLRRVRSGFSGPVHLRPIGRPTGLRPAAGPVRPGPADVRAATGLRPAVRSARPAALSGPAGLPRLWPAVRPAGAAAAVRRPDEPAVPEPLPAAAGRLSERAARAEEGLVAAMGAARGRAAGDRRWCGGGAGADRHTG